MFDKIYENVKGLKVDIPIVSKQGTSVSIAMMTTQCFYVQYPGETEEHIWEVEKILPNLLRHIIPQDAELAPGKYKIQPYIELVDGYKGRATTVDLRLNPNMR